MSIVAVGLHMSACALCNSIYQDALHLSAEHPSTCSGLRCLAFFLFCRLLYHSGERLCVAPGAPSCGKSCVQLSRSGHWCVEHCAFVKT